MHALSVIPGTANSTRLVTVAEPAESDGAVIAQTLAIGVCGTDTDIAAGTYGWPPPGRERLIIGHESIARVLEAPRDCGLHAGDLIAGIVRRPDPVPCDYCAAGEWDMCRNGRYTERGIKERDGYAAEVIRIEPAFAVRIDPALGLAGVLLEPASVVAKAWDHVERIGGRSSAWEPRTVLITGAGPIGLLAAMLGRQRGLEVHVLDRAESGPKPGLVRDLGGRYFTGGVRDLDPPPDVIVEATGASQVVVDAMGHTAPNGMVCLTGISSGGHCISL